MVSNASDDLPDPDTPVITVSFSWGIESEMFLRLWTRAPWIRIKSSTGILIIRLRSRGPVRSAGLLAILANNGRIKVMPTRNVNLTAELDRFVLEKVRRGRYENASEVVRAALRMLEREERQYEAKLVTLRAAIDAGDASGVAEGDVFTRVRGALNLPPTPR